jgi:hypothetical protein
MKSFRDAENREWFLRLDFETLERVEASTGVKLDDIASDNPQSVVAVQSAVTRGKVLWAMVEPQANERGITRAQFAKAMDGPAMYAAHKALLDEQVFFSPPEYRVILELSLRAQEEHNAKAVEEARREAEKLLSDASASKSPESSESIQPAGASAS